MHKEMSSNTSDGVDNYRDSVRSSGSVGLCFLVWSEMASLTK